MAIDDREAARVFDEQRRRNAAAPAGSQPLLGGERNAVPRQEPQLEGPPPQTRMPGTPAAPVMPRSYMQKPTLTPRPAAPAMDMDNTLNRQALLAALNARENEMTP